MNPILQQLDALHDEKVTEILNNIHKNSPPLHHYTSLKNGVNIIQNNTLRFTNMFYLNDPAEMHHGLEIGEEVMIDLIYEYSSRGEKPSADLLGVLLLKLAIGFAPSSKRQQKADDLKNKLCRYISSSALNSTLPATLNGCEWSLHVSCLSEQKDDLRQWLPYGDNAQGIALEFKPIIDNYHFLTKDPRVFIIRVSYENNLTKTKYLSEFLKSALNLYKNNAERLLENQWINKLIELLVGDLVACKSPHYSDEKEWRLFFMQSKSDKLLSDDPGPSFYVKGSLLRPYYDIELEEGAIIGIKLGAQCNNDLNLDALEMLCFNKASVGISITKSAIGYRG